MADFQIQMCFKNGERWETTYRKLLPVLGLEHERFVRKPFTEGTVRQAHFVAALLEEAPLGIERVIIYDECGQEI